MKGNLFRLTRAKNGARVRREIYLKYLTSRNSVFDKSINCNSYHALYIRDFCLYRYNIHSNGGSYGFRKLILRQRLRFSKTPGIRRHNTTRDAGMLAEECASSRSERSTISTPAFVEISFALALARLDSLVHSLRICDVHTPLSSRLHSGNRRGHFSISLARREVHAAAASASCIVELKILIEAAFYLLFLKSLFSVPTLS